MVTQPGGVLKNIAQRQRAYFKTVKIAKVYEPYIRALLRTAALNRAGFVPGPHRVSARGRED